MAKQVKRWTVRRSRRRLHGYWEIVNGHGVVAVVYATESDARLMAMAPEAIAELTRLVRARPNTKAHDDAMAAALALIEAARS